MTVLSKVVAGSVRVRSFDVVARSGETLTARPSEQTVDAPGVVALFPDVCNLHEFTAGPAGVAILDIMTPPYDADDDRDCHYLEVVDPGIEVATLRVLDDVDEPDFECLGAPYAGLRPDA